MPPSVWTQGVTANWRPRLSFYDQSLPLLQAIEAEGLLHAFRVEPSEVAVRLKDDEHELALSATSLTLRASTPNPDLDRLRKHGGRASAAIAPTLVTRVIAEFQHLAPLQGDYDQVRVSIAEAFYQSWVREANVTDHAVLVDGKSSSGAATYTMEFGIVSAAEIPPRLERTVGRLGRRAPQTMTHSGRWNQMELPDVALFADSKWFSTGPPEGDDLFAGILQYWDEMRSEADKILGKLALLAEAAIRSHAANGEEVTT